MWYWDEQKKENNTLRIIMIHRYVTPVGFDNLLLRADGEVLTGLWFEGSHYDDLERYSSEMCHDLPVQSVLRDTCRWLDVYFSGRQPDFTPPYRMEGLTSFRREVLEMVEKIPFGRVMTYGDIASTLARRRGIPKMSAQAVGGAVGWNPICLIVPCHRVVGANGKLTGYGGGMNNKIALLKMENYSNDDESFLKFL